MDKALKRISGLLTQSTNEELDEDVPFFVERELLPSDVVINVKNVGVLNCPASEQNVKKIIDISSKSRFGLRDQTVLDENIRNSYEVKADKLQVTLNENFSTMLSEMGQALGLPENAELKPYLHNMLIYGPGQFFRKHKDTEKLNGMVATLVIALSSPHVGGDLIIEHKGEKHTFSSGNMNSTTTKCIAFYSDCEHEVTKIQQGYRIALTYNLVLPSGHVPSGNINLRLKSAIVAYFKMAKSVERNTTRNYLVYFLNHSYTEHSLRWDMLKGTDRKNAFEMFNVAKKLALIPNLTLVEIHELYSNGGDEPNYKYARYDESGDDEMSDGSYDDDPITDEGSAEFIEKETTLSHWVGPNNEDLLLKEVDISDNNICWTKDPKEFEPDKEDYSGYTGNEGCSTDYWYRRAAVVLVQASLNSKYLVDFSHNYNAAVNEFFKLIKQPSNEKQVLKMIENAEEHLYKKTSGDDENDFKTFTELALNIESRRVAQNLLSYFDWNIFNLDITEILVKLQNKYDAAFLCTLVTSWKDQNVKKHKGQLNVLKNFYAIVDCLFAHGIDVAVIQMMIEIEKTSALEEFRKVIPSYYLEFGKPTAYEKMKRLKQILQACLLVPSETSQIQIVNCIIENPKSYSTHDLANLFFELRKTPSSNQKPYYKPLKDYLVAMVTEQRTIHNRSNDDWSINVELPCNCEYCKIAKQFLESKKEVKKVWPIIQKHREHVCLTLERLKLPLTLSVECTGRPYKQIISKDKDFHKNIKKEFDKFTSYLIDLQTEPC